MEYNSRMRCAGKVGVVTGCTAGIGLATITKMVEEGAEVYMLVRNLEKAKPIAEELNKKGPGRVADMIWFDARMIETIEPAIKKAYEEAGRIDMFVNNAIGTGDVRPSQVLCKPPEWCRIEAPRRRFTIWPERIAPRKKIPAERRSVSCCSWQTSGAWMTSRICSRRPLPNL
ncbi:MAG: SDR family NAD(P)-dependent oxidoreductase [Lachnospiraceae bacterium]